MGRSDPASGSYLRDFEIPPPPGLAQDGGPPATAPPSPPPSPRPRLSWRPTLAFRPSTCHSHSGTAAAALRATGTAREGAATDSLPAQASRCRLPPGAGEGGGYLPRAGQVTLTATKRRREGRSAKTLCSRRHRDCDSRGNSRLRSERLRRRQNCITMRAASWVDSGCSTAPPTPPARRPHIRVLF